MLTNTEVDQLSAQATSASVDSTGQPSNPPTNSSGIQSFNSSSTSSLGGV